MMVRDVLSRVDPDLVIQEAMYGFIMALTLMVTAQIGLIHYDRPEDLIIAIIGMDFVWGAIDMYIYFRADVFASRRRLLKYIDMVSLKSRNDQKDLIRDEFDGTMFEFASEKDRDRIMDVFISGEFTEANVLRRSTFTYAINAVAAFVISMLTVLPSVAALMLIEDLSMALLCSSLVSAFALFFTGYYMAPGTSAKSRVLTGLFTAGLALLFTLFAAYFGG